MFVKICSKVTTGANSGRWLACIKIPGSVCAALHIVYVLYHTIVEYKQFSEKSLAFKSARLLSILN